MPKKKKLKKTSKPNHLLGKFHVKYPKLIHRSFSFLAIFYAIEIERERGRRPTQLYISCAFVTDFLGHDLSLLRCSLTIFLEPNPVLKQPIDLLATSPIQTHIYKHTHTYTHLYMHRCVMFRDIFVKKKNSKR